MVWIVGFLWEKFHFSIAPTMTIIKKLFPSRLQTPKPPLKPTNPFLTAVNTITACLDQIPPNLSPERPGSLEYEWSCCGYDVELEILPSGGFHLQCERAR